MTKKKDSISTFEILNWMIKEEWRVHTELFGSKRFIFFPIIIGILSIILGLSVPLINSDPFILSILLYGLIGIMGFQIGLIGFKARDSLEDVLGGSQRIIHQSDRLPLSQSRIVSAFLLKDSIFYSSIFIIPILSGITIGFINSPFIDITEINYLNVSVILYLYLLSIITFIFGVSLGFTISSSNYDNYETYVILSILTIIPLYLMNINSFDLNAIQAFSFRSLILFLLLYTILLFYIGSRQFKLQNNRKIQKQNNMYKKIADKFNTDFKSVPIAIKTYLDIQRSIGGLSKIIISTLVIIITGLLMTSFVVNYYDVYPIIYILFASLFSFIGYSIYVFVYRYDIIDDYMHLPIHKNDVNIGKSLIYIFLSVPIGIAYYSPIVLLSDPTFKEYIIGSIIITSILMYQLLLLLTLVKDKPLDLLFDGQIYGIFNIFIMIMILPILIVGLFGSFISINIINLILIYTISLGIFSSLIISNKYYLNLI